jgi:hypothetical protein
VVCAWSLSREKARSEDIDIRPASGTRPGTGTGTRENDLGFGEIK